MARLPTGGNQRDRLNIRRSRMMRPVIIGGGEGSIIDVSDPSASSLTKLSDPATNFNGVLQALSSSSDRVPVTDVFERVGIVYDLTSVADFVGNDLLAITGMMGASFSCDVNSGGIASVSVSLKVSLYSEQIDPATVTYNDMAALITDYSSFSASLTAPFIPTFSSAGLLTQSSAKMGYAIYGHTITTSPVRTLWVELQSPGVPGNSFAEAAFSEAPSFPRIYLR